ncbi:hypothetical protein pb186bvf_012189 [Paramecium bursaria]
MICCAKRKKKLVSQMQSINREVSTNALETTPSIVRYRATQYLPVLNINRTPFKKYFFKTDPQAILLSEKGGFRLFLNS